MIKNDLTTPTDRETEKTLTKQELVLANARYAITLAKQHNRDHEPLEDTIQSAILGLALATETYDPSTGNRFLSHAKWKALTEIDKHLTTATQHHRKSRPRETESITEYHENNLRSNHHETIENEITIGQIKHLMETTLTEEELEITKLHLGLDPRGPLSLSSIARIKEKPRTTINHIYKRSIDKLKDRIKRKKRKKKATPKHAPAYY